MESRDKRSRLRVERAVRSAVCRDGRQRFYPAGSPKAGGKACMQGAYSKNLIIGCSYRNEHKRASLYVHLPGPRRTSPLFSPPDPSPGVIIEAAFSAFFPEQVS